MLVCECHHVLYDGAVVGLLHAREGERAGDEFARCWVGGWRRLVRVERAAVVSGRAELVSIMAYISIQSHSPSGRFEYAYVSSHLLGGNCFFLCRALPTGS